MRHCLTSLSRVAEQWQTVHPAGHTSARVVGRGVEELTLGLFAAREQEPEAVRR